MLSPPTGFTDEDVAKALSEHWNLPASSVAYRPVGFGSHHWSVDDRWFVTVDEAPDFARLSAALRSAADVPVAIAPIPTHGEPHAGNTMLTPAGWHLIDWDTALVAPPERDLWHLETPETLAAYEEATGVGPDADVLELYRLRWDLTDLAEVTRDFSRPHTGTPNDVENWAILQDILSL